MAQHYWNIDEAIRRDKLILAEFKTSRNRENQ